jgi:pimeloyl-ACP methyl ester carboxylesterase
MPFATHRGMRIHYQVEGQGPVIVLQHGMLDRASSWKDLGYVAALADAHRVVWVDSLGHGESDKPGDPAAYSLAERALDIVAVLDAVGAETAHLVGYSMGGWIASGVALHHAERLSSLVVGGWDVERGAATASDSLQQLTGRELDYEGLLAGARVMAPELVEWVTPEVEPGLRACWDALQRLEGTAQAVAKLGCPVLLWNGRDDPYHGPMQAFASSRSLRFLSVPGDHIAAMLDESGESRKGLRAFFDLVASIG